MTLPLRPARPSDAPGMAEVFVSSWRAGYRDVVPPDVLRGLDVAAVTEWMARLVGDGGATTVVATLADALVGWTRFGPDRDRPGPDTGYLASLYVHPSIAGRGAGRTLLEHALAALGEDGRTDVRLWVFEANARARALHERAGFRPDGSRTMDPQWRAPQVGYRRGPLDTAVPMPELR